MPHVPIHTAVLREEFFANLVNLINDRIVQQTSKPITTEAQRTQRNLCDLCVSVVQRL
jgi:hypothetical protein